jgi:hypothetical protein
LLLASWKPLSFAVSLCLFVAWFSPRRATLDYAIASVEQAKLAVLDAVEGRVQAGQAKQA